MEILNITALAVRVWPTVTPDTARKRLERKLLNGKLDDEEKAIVKKELALLNKNMRRVLK